MEAPGRALKLDPIKSIKKAPEEEYYQSGHRTCQGCLSALPMRLMAKAAGPRTIVTGATGCMYVANTTYMSTPWVVPWMHTQLGAAGSSAVGTSAGLKSLMKKGKIKDEPINVIAFCGDGGRSEEHTSELQSRQYLVCRLLLEKKKNSVLNRLFTI